MAISVTVLGLKIGESLEDFESYQANQNSAGAYSVQNTGSENSLRLLTHALRTMEEEHNQQDIRVFCCVVVYDKSCSKKEEHLKMIQEKIAQTNTKLLPSLICIGGESAKDSLSEDIRKGFIFEPLPAGFSFKSCVDSKLLLEFARALTLEEKKNAEDSKRAASATSRMGYRTTTNIPMLILEGFVAVLGIAALALYFLAAVASSPFWAIAGGGLTVAGFGFFAAGAHKQEEWGSIPSNTPC